MAKRCCFDSVQVKLQQYINASFERIESIGGSLDTLEKFKRVFVRDSLRGDLDDKVSVIFNAYHSEREFNTFRIIIPFWIA